MRQVIVQNDVTVVKLGRKAYTALSPGKIDCWVVLSAIGGAVTHRIEKDEDGKIILVPVEE